ncbi:MAG: helix-turn-helix domain-containing protein [Candidatus Woesearchaeota archaeon]
MDKKILYEIGLSEREISVYTSLLKLGSSTTGPVIKSSGVQSAKIYETLDKLIKKGLATFIVKDKIKYFQASDPNILLSMFEEKKENLSKTVRELNAIKNMIESEYDSKVYEGIKAIKSVFFEMYNYIGKNSEYCVFPLGEQLNSEELLLFWSQVLHKQRAMKISIRTLPNKKWKKIFQDHYGKYEFIKIRYSDQTFPTGIFIFKDHVLNVLWSEKPVAFLIKSKENYLRWQKFFDEQWKKRIK